MKLVFFYDETEERRAYGGVPIEKLDPHKQYIRHYEKYLQLAFWASSSKKREARRAGTELDICIRKLLFWSGRPTFDVTRIVSEVHRVQRQYGITEEAPIAKKKSHS